MDARLLLAEELLQEAVYASRAKQAAGLSLLAAREKDGSSPGNCGLGKEAAIALELSAQGRSALDALWPESLGSAELERIRSVLAAWVERQDQLDRDRNHFLKAFRARHGIDRGAWAVQEAAAFDQGLVRINSQVEAERLAAAESVLGDRRPRACS